MFKPKALQAGDTVAIAAPASPFDKQELLFGVKMLKEMGFNVTFRKDIFSSERYLAGSDVRRADELNGFFADPSVKAIFFARGGYGTQRILHLLDTDTIKANPKIVVGYSDITALHIWLKAHGVGGSFYGPTVARHFRHAHKRSIELLMQTVTARKSLGRLTATGARVQRHGRAEGTLVGGCLSLIVSSIGTPYDLNTDGSILFLEDVLEPVYKYDRMLTQLKASGKLQNVNGIIFGSMSLSKGEKPAWLKPMLKDVLKEFPGPIITDFPTGHFSLDKLFVTLPLGVNVKLDTKPLQLEITEPSLL